MNPRPPSHHTHRSSTHVSANTHVTVTPPPATPTHHRANSSGGTTGTNILSTLTSPDNDTTNLVTGLIGMILVGGGWVLKQFLI